MTDSTQQVQASSAMMFWRAVWPGLARTWPAHLVSLGISALFWDAQQEPASRNAGPYLLLLLPMAMVAALTAMLAARRRAGAVLEAAIASVGAGLVTAAVWALLFFFGEISCSFGPRACYPGVLGRVMIVFALQFGLLAHSFTAATIKERGGDVGW